MRNRKALGRGLHSLLEEKIVPIDVESTTEIDINLVHINNEHPRKYFNNKEIEELADSISTHGLLQPIIVKKEISGKYKIVSGERRYRACKISRLKKIPVIIRDFDKQKMLEVALIKNIHRDQLTAIEEAEGYQKLISDYGYTQSKLATIIGKSYSYIKNFMCLNELPESIKNMVHNGSLTIAHAICLVGLDNVEDFAKKIIKNSLSVETTKRLSSVSKNNKKLKQANELGETELICHEKDSDLILISDLLSKKLGVEVIVENLNSGGKISIYYRKLEELDSILTKLN